MRDRPPSLPRCSSQEKPTLSRGPSQCSTRASSRPPSRTSSQCSGHAPSLPPSSRNSAHGGRCGDLTMDQFWTLCEIFGKMDRDRKGMVKRTDFVWAIRALGTDTEFRNMLRRTALMSRFYATAKDLTMEEYIALAVPHARTTDLALACHWANLWDAQRTVKTSGFKGTPQELQWLFEVLDETGAGTVPLKELVHAHFFSREEVMALLPKGRGTEPLSFVEFCECIAPELRTRYGGHDSPPCKTDAQKSRLDRLAVFQKALVHVRAKSDSESESSPEEAAVPLFVPSRPSGLPRLPSSSRSQSAARCRSSSGSRKAGGDGANKDMPSAEMTKEEPAQRFQTLRTRVAHSVCSGGMDDACLQKCDFLKDRSHLFLTFLLDELQCEMFKPGDVIISEGDLGDKMYFLRRGRVEVLVGPELKKVVELSDGSAFGEMALFGDSCKRTATVRATDLCDCRAVGKRTFLKLLQCFPEDEAFFRQMARQRRAQQEKKSNPDSRRSSSARRASLRTPRENKS